ncbi:MAG: Gx transporter family protein [Clostridium sp.]|nr:Gx transporter family protein [Clostridium sp.]
MRANHKAARAAFGGLLVALAFLFGYVEMLIPVSLGIPGVKLGLANLVTITAIFLLGVPQAAAVTVIRVILTGFTFGNMSMMMYSMSGALLSLAVMAALKKADLFGTVGISIAGGVSHNLGQLLCAMAVLKNPHLMYYFPVLLAAGCAAGAAIGILGAETVKRLKPLSFLDRDGGEA